jgi:hypothetical protein
MRRCLRPAPEHQVRFFPRVAFIGIGLLVAIGCDSTGPGGSKGPGWVTATLSSPNGSEASAVFELTGGTDLGFVSADGGETFHQHSVGSSRVVVVLDEPGVIRFRVGTEDVGDLPTVSVLQVGDGQNRLRSSLTGYQVHLEGEKYSSGGGGE